MLFIYKKYISSIYALNDSSQPFSNQFICQWNVIRFFFFFLKYCVCLLYCNNVNNIFCFLRDDANITWSLLSCSQFWPWYVQHVFEKTWEQKESVLSCLNCVEKRNFPNALQTLQMTSKFESRILKKAAHNKTWSHEKHCLHAYA